MIGYYTKLINSIAVYTVEDKRLSSCWKQCDSGGS